MSQRKFAHSARLDYSKGKLRAYCCCGKQSPVFEDIEEEYLFVSREEQADQWIVSHTGLREVQPGRK